MLLGSSTPAPGPAMLPAATAPAVPGVGAGEAEVCAVGVELSIGNYRIRCSSTLGRGSFSEVWAAEMLAGPGPFQDVALKDITCNNQQELQQAQFEATLLERIQGLGSAAGPGQAPVSLRVPRYLGHRVDQTRRGWSLRMAMTRTPGEPMDQFLRRRPPPSQDGPNSVRCGCALAMQLIRQLGPTLDCVSRAAWHRDVNSHNILLSDAVDGGPFQPIADAEETSRRASFWLIDFGLAVDSAGWNSAWPTSDVAGDCRYWPPSSFLMSFYGPDEMSNHPDFCNQYQTRLDVVGLGLSALELLCATAVASDDRWGAGGLRGSWRRLFDAWKQYREEVTRWHTQIFQVFSVGGDIGPLYQQLAKERVVDRVIAHVAKLRGLLRACTQRAEDLKIQTLLSILADMLDEKSTLSMREAAESLGPDMSPQPAPSTAQWAPAPAGPWAAAPPAQWVSIAPAPCVGPPARKVAPPRARRTEPEGGCSSAPLAQQWCQPHPVTLSYQPPPTQPPVAQQATRCLSREGSLQPQKGRGCAVPAVPSVAPRSARPWLAGA